MGCTLWEGARIPPLFVWYKILEQPLLPAALGVAGPRGAAVTLLAPRAPRPLLQQHLHSKSSLSPAGINYIFVGKVANSKVQNTFDKQMKC